MADQNLDDFFAKKDKKKKKSKSKFVASDLLIAQESTNVEKPSKKKEKKQNQLEASGSASASKDGTSKQENLNEEEEWVDFEQEEEKDYTGLRIQNLQITKAEQEQEVEDNDNTNDEAGESGEKRETASGPWNVKEQQSAPTPAVVQPPPVSVPEPPKEDGPKKYVPPGARSAAAGLALEPTRLGQRRKKTTAPNLTSEEDFPTLGGGSPDVGAGGPWSGDSRGGFERVNTGGRQTDIQSGSMQLTLGNKFSALQQQ